MSPRVPLGFPWLARCAFLVALGSFGAVQQARAVPIGCVLSGGAPLPDQTQLLDEKGGAFARFTGVPLPIQVSNLPATSDGRARLAILGTRGFLLEGWVTARTLPLTTRRPVAVYPEHVWIPGRRSVDFLEAREGRLKVQLRLTYPLTQTLEAWDTCDAFGLEPSGAPVISPPVGIGVLMVSPSAELFAAPTSVQSPLLRITRSTALPGLLLWNSESRGGFRRVHLSGEVTLDGWMRESDLVPLPVGETADQYDPRSTTAQSRRFSLPESTRVVLAMRSVDLRSSPNTTSPRIGTIAPGTETYVLDTVAGWVSVLPRGLEVMPAEGKHFWVRSDDVGVVP